MLLYIADELRSLCDGKQFHIIIVIFFFSLFTSTMPPFPSSRCRLRILPLPTPNCPYSCFLAPGYVLAVVGACACLAHWFAVHVCLFLHDACAMLGS
jgi:hypothetical protein